MKTPLVLAVFVIVTALIGCRSEPPKGAVSGTATYRNKPVDIGYIIFISLDRMHTASSQFDAEGGYRLTTDLPPGDYIVGIAPPLPPSGDFEGAPPVWSKKSPVPEKYHAAEKSGLTFTVVEGENVADFNLN